MVFVRRLRFGKGAMKDTGKTSAGEQAPHSAQGRPIQIRMGGYGPTTASA